MLDTASVVAAGSAGVFLGLNRSEKERQMGPREWVMAKAQFVVIFGERFTGAMAA